MTVEHEETQENRQRSWIEALHNEMTDLLLNLGSACAKRRRGRDANARRIPWSASGVRATNRVVHITIIGLTLCACSGSERARPVPAPGRANVAEATPGTSGAQARQLAEDATLKTQS